MKKELDSQRPPAMLEQKRACQVEIFFLNHLEQARYVNEKKSSSQRPPAVFKEGSLCQRL